MQGADDAAAVATTTTSEHADPPLPLGNADAAAPPPPPPPAAGSSDNAADDDNVAVAPPAPAPVSEPKIAPDAEIADDVPLIQSGDDDADDDAPVASTPPTQNFAVGSAAEDSAGIAAPLVAPTPPTAAAAAADPRPEPSASAEELAPLDKPSPAAPSRGLTGLVAQLAAKRLARIKEPEPSPESVAAIAEAAAAVEQLEAARAAEAAESALPQAKAARAENGNTNGDAAADANALVPTPTAAEIAAELTTQLKRLMKWHQREEPDVSKDVPGVALCESAFTALVCAVALMRETVSPLEMDQRVSTSRMRLPLPSIAFDEAVTVTAAQCGFETSRENDEAPVRRRWCRWVRHMCEVAFGVSTAALPERTAAAAEQQQATKTAAVQPPQSQQKIPQKQPLPPTTTESALNNASAAATPQKRGTESVATSDDAAAKAIPRMPVKRATIQHLAAMHSPENTGLTPAQARRMHGVLARRKTGDAAAAFQLAGQVYCLLITLRHGEHALSSRGGIAAGRAASFHAKAFDPPPAQAADLHDVRSQADAHTVAELYSDIPASWNVARRIAFTVPVPGRRHAAILCDLRGVPIFSPNSSCICDTPRMSFTRVASELQNSGSLLFSKVSTYVFVTDELAGSHPQAIGAPQPDAPGAALNEQQQRQKALMDTVLAPALATKEWLTAALAGASRRKGVPSPAELQDFTRWAIFARNFAMGPPS